MGTLNDTTKVDHDKKCDVQKHCIKLDQMLGTVRHWVLTHLQCCLLCSCLLLGMCDVMDGGTGTGLLASTLLWTKAVRQHSEDKHHNANNAKEACFQALRQETLLNFGHNSTQTADFSHSMRTRDS